MLIHLAVPLAPAVELAGCNVEPPDETPGADLGLPRPTPDEIHAIRYGPAFISNGFSVLQEGKNNLFVGKVGVNLRKGDDGTLALGSFHEKT
jgi:hypothetical protein